MRSREVQVVFGTNAFGPSGNIRNRVVLIDGGSKEKTKLSMEKFLLLLRMKMRGNKEKGEFEFTQYIECSRPHDNMDDALKYKGHSWSTDDDIDHTFV